MFQNRHASGKFRSAFRFFPFLEHDATNDSAAFLGEDVHLLAGFLQPAAACEALFAHQTAENLVVVGMLLAEAAQAECAGEPLPDGHREHLGGEGGLALLFELFGSEQDFLGNGEVIHVRVGHGNPP